MDPTSKMSDAISKRIADGIRNYLSIGHERHVVELY